MSESQFEAEKKAFIRPFPMLNSLLWRGFIAVTESHVHLVMDFDHAIADGTMARRVFQQIFEALNGRELQKDRYYLYLHRLALRAETPEFRADHELVRSLYDGQWSRFPQPDFDSRDNSNLSCAAATRHTFSEYLAAAEAN